MILSPTQVSILTRLSLTKETFVAALVRHAGGDVHKGSVYTLLNRMEAKGLLTSRKEVMPVDDNRPPRRMLLLTEEGQRELAAYRAAVAAYKKAKEKP